MRGLSMEERMRIVWIVEMRNEDGTWHPCAAASLTRGEARVERRAFAEANEHDRFRVWPYVPQRRNTA